MSSFRFWAPVLLFALALGLRLIGIGWGLKNDLHNQSYHPDEEVIWNFSQAIEPAKLKFTPGFYNYGTLYLTVLRVASDMTAAYTGGPDGKTEDSFWSFVSRCHQSGRLLSAIAGALTAVMLFLIVRRFTSEFGAWMAGGLIALAPAHVVHSRFQTVDVLATLFLAVSAYYALRLFPVKEGEAPDVLRLSAWCGVFAGLSAGTKYTGILALATLYVALGLVCPPKAAIGALVGTVTSILTFLVATPGALLDTEKFMRDFRYEMAHTSTGHGLVFEGTPSGFLYHTMNLGAGLGLILALVAFVGLLVMASKGQRWLWALGAFFLIYFVLIGRAEVKFLRYTFPLYVALAAGFGAWMAHAHEAGKLNRIAVALGIAGLVGLDFGGLRQTAVMTSWMTGEDPRDEAARYLRNLPADATTIGLTSLPWFYTPPLFRDSTGSLMRFSPERKIEALATATPRTVFYVPASEPFFSFDTRLLTDLKPSHVVASSFEVADPKRLVGVAGLKPEVKLQADRIVEFERVLKEGYELDRVYGVGRVPIHDLEYIRPEVQIWRRKSP